MSFSQKGVQKTVFPRTSAKVSLQIFHRVYRACVKPGYRMNNKKRSMRWEPWPGESQMYFWRESASVLFLMTYKTLRWTVWDCKRRKDVFAEEMCSNRSLCEQMARVGVGHLLWHWSPWDLVVGNIQVAWRKIRLHGTDISKFLREVSSQTHRQQDTHSRIDLTLVDNTDKVLIIIIIIMMRLADTLLSTASNGRALLDSAPTKNFVLPSAKKERKKSSRRNKRCWKKRAST